MKLTQEQTPYDNLVTAISILQADYFAEDSFSEGVTPSFGVFRMAGPARKHAINLLIELIPAVEEFSDRQSAKSGKEADDE